MDNQLFRRLEVLGFLVERREDTNLYDLYKLEGNHPIIGTLVAKDVDEAQVKKFLEGREYATARRANV